MQANRRLLLHRHPVPRSRKAFHLFRNTHTHTHTHTNTLAVGPHTTHSLTQTHNRYSFYTHTHSSLHPLAQKFKAHTGTCTHKQLTHTLSPHSEGLRAHWGKSSSNAAHLPVARKRRVASRSWGDILTFISLSVGLKAEKSCFLSRWVIFFFVLLSAEEGKLKDGVETQNFNFFLQQEKRHSISLHRYWVVPGQRVTKLELPKSLLLFPET